MEEEKVPNISRTRVGDIEGTGSLDNPPSNFEHGSLDDEVYGGAVGDAAAGGMHFADEAYNAASRNQHHRRENSFQEIAGLADGAGGADLGVNHYPSMGSADPVPPGRDGRMAPHPGSQGSREDLTAPITTTDQSQARLISQDSASGS